MRRARIQIIVVLIGVVGLSPAGAATTSYQYDALGRLTTVDQGSGQTTYNYDFAGNRSSKQVTSITPTAITLAGQTTLVEKQGVVTLTFNVGNSSASGNVSIYANAALIGTASVTNGVVTVAVTGLPVGPNSITLAYAGSGALAANSATVSVNVVNLSWLPAVLKLLLN